MRLTDRNIDRLCIACAIAELPRTFQHAVVVSRALRVRYLWIDSLCILQDNHSDWAFEANKMNMLYSNSHCNISASHAGDSSEGLFRHRVPDLCQENKVSLCHDTRCLLDNPHHAYYVTDIRLLMNSVERCKLNKRGWVLQEK